MTTLGAYLVLLLFFSEHQTIFRISIKREDNPLLSLSPLFFFCTMPYPFSAASHYTLSLSADMPLIEECKFHVAKPQMGRYNDQFRYISVSQDDERQFGNLGLTGAKPNARLFIVNVDGNSNTVRLKPDRHGNEHPLLHALKGIEQKAIHAYDRDAKDGKTLGPVVRVPSQAGHDHLVKLKRLHATLDPNGESAFEQSLEVTRYIGCAQKITYYKGQHSMSLNW
jgi:hypothetical protein